MVALFSRAFYKEDSFLKYTLGIIILVGFYTFSIALFVELNAEQHGFLGQLNEFFFGFVKTMFPAYYEAHPNATSCEFMFSSAEPWIKNWETAPDGIFKWLGSIFNFHVPFDNLAELVAGGYNQYLMFGVAMFCAYPLFLYLGTQVGFLIFGRKPGDKGALGFL